MSNPLLDSPVLLDPGPPQSPVEPTEFEVGARGFFSLSIFFFFEHSVGVTNFLVHFMLSLPQYLRNILYEYMMGRERKVRKLDQHKYVGNCPPTPPLTQQQSIDNSLGLMLG